jgi:alpha-L-rhamnosidase
MNARSGFDRLLGCLSVLAGVCCVTGSASGWPWASAPRNLRTEFQVNPVGIDVNAPRLSWELDDGRRGAVQTACQVLVASKEKCLRVNYGDVWDSGKVTSDQSHLVAYGGSPLPSRTEYWWKVRVWDKADRPSAWSEPAYWSMGLLSQSDWTAKWIGRDETPSLQSTPEKELKSAQWIWFPEGNPATSAPVGKRYFRRPFDIPSDRKVRLAVCSMSADNSFTLYVNGTKLGSGSSFEQAGTFDVTRCLRPGDNVIAVMANNMGDAPNPAGLIGAVRIEFEQGQPLVVVTDDQWRTSDKEAAGWQGLSFQAAGWMSAKPLGQYGMAPWKDIKVVPLEDRRLPARYLRREFTADRKIKRASASICGLGYYELYLNGKRVGDHVLDPALTDPARRCLYVTYDVTDHLRRGANAVGVILGNGRYFAPRITEPIATTTYGYPKLLLQMQVEYEDGGTLDVVSDESWKLTTNGPIRANNDYDGEEYDARMEMPGWCSRGFDDSTWDSAQLVKAPGGTLAAEMIEPCRVTKIIKPVSISQVKPGVYIYDMGQNMVGWCRLTVKGPAGTTVTLRHAETLTKDGSALYLANLRSCKVTDTYILKGKGTEVYEPRFTYHGFRYVELTGYPGKPGLSTIEGRVVHSDLERMGGFACSDPTIMRVYHNILWGIRGNLRSIPTDCPQRDERQGWLGDIANESKHESFELNAFNFYTKWLQDIEEAQDSKGNLPDVAPRFWTIYSTNVTWPSAYVIIPEWFHEQYGDTRPMAAHYASWCKWIEFMSQYLKDDLMPKDTYGDWCVPPEKKELIHSRDPARKTDATVLGTTYFYHDLCLLAKYATLLGKSDDAQKWTSLAERMKAAFNKKFFHADTGTYSNGTQTSSVLPLAFGMVPAEHRQRVFNNLVENIMVKCQGHLATGLIGGQWLMRVLSDNGRPDVALKLAQERSYPSWGYMADHGATTIWELWNGDTADPAMNSHNHLMLVGDLGIWLYQYVAGIRSDPAHPAFKRIWIRPVPTGDLKWAKAEHHTPHGWVRSEWHLTKHGLTLNVTIPANTTAEVHVPTLGKQDVTISEGWTKIVSNSQPAKTAEGITFIRMDKTAAVFDVMAGSYKFTLRGK